MKLVVGFLVDFGKSHEKREEGFDFDPGGIVENELVAWTSAEMDSNCEGWSLSPMMSQGNIPNDNVRWSGPNSQESTPATANHQPKQSSLELQHIDINPSMPNFA